MRRRLLAIIGLVGLAALTMGTGHAANRVRPVEITSPADGDLLTGIQTVTVDVHDSFTADVVVLSVDGQTVGFDSTAPYAIDWNTSSAVPGITHEVVARAYGSREASVAGRGITYQEFADSKPIAIRVEGISITSPKAGDVVSQGTVDAPTEVDATAAVSGTIAKVELYADGVLADTFGDETEETIDGNDFVLGWKTEALKNGSAHTLLAKVYFGDPQQIATSVPIVVNISGTRLLGIADDDVVSGTVALAADVADASGVSVVKFIIDGDVAGSDDAAPYSFAWDTSGLRPGSQHVIKVRAVNGDGADVDSENVGVYVAGVSIASPRNGVDEENNPITAWAPRTTTVAIDAGDVDGIDHVTLYEDGNLVGTTTERPFLIEWDTSGFANGTHKTLTATYTDTANNVSPLSLAVDVVVDKDLPTLSTSIADGDVLVSGPGLPDDAPAQITSFITGSAADVGSSLLGVNVVLQGDTGNTAAGSAAINGTGGWSFGVPFVILPGNYLVTISATDEAGNNTVITRTVVIA